MMDYMKAFVRLHAQTNDVALKEMPIPEPDAGEVLIQVKAFGVGIHDRYFIPRDVDFPYPIGSEGAGIIAKLGPNVGDFCIDDHVIFSSSLQPKGGCWAEYVVVSTQSIMPLPENMDFTVGASLPVAGKTALESMHALDLQKNETLFIAGASGAIGTLMIQLAKLKSVRIIGSASSQNQGYMKTLGADDTVDYTDPNWKDKVLKLMPGGVNVALAIQPDTTQDSMDIVKDGGRVITVSGDTVESERNITVKQFQHQLNFQQALSNLINDIVSDNVQIKLEHIYPFKEAIDALEKTETRHAQGKLVVRV